MNERPLNLLHGARDPPILLARPCNASNSPCTKSNQTNCKRAKVHWLNAPSDMDYGSCIFQVPRFFNWRKNREQKVHCKSGCNPRGSAKVQVTAVSENASTLLDGAPVAFLHTMQCKFFAVMSSRLFAMHLHYVNVADAISSEIPLCAARPWSRITVGSRNPFVRRQRRMHAY